MGANAFSVRVTDTAGTSATATLNINVANVNDAPTWTAATITKSSARETTSSTDTLAADASDIDAGETLSFSKISGPPWLTVAPNGALSGVPAVGDAGTNTFVVRVTDSASATSDATVEITVTPASADERPALTALRDWLVAQASGEAPPAERR